LSPRREQQHNTTVTACLDVHQFGTNILPRSARGRHDGRLRRATCRVALPAPPLPIFLEVSLSPFTANGCVAHYTKMAHQHGATRDEVVETVTLAVYMGGGPAADALRAYDQFSGKS
jgi:carboxymuconolactone decarboxylase family protein